MFRKLKKELQGDIRAARHIRLHWRALLILFVVALPLPWVFDRFGRLNLFLPTFNGVFVLVLVVVVKRTLMRHAWFWATMAVLAALHVVLILLVPWTTKWVPALTIAGIASVDFIVMLTIVDVVERFMAEPRIANGEPGR